MPDPIPYCGLPPVPAELWARWTLDPVLLAALCGLAAAILLPSRSRRERALAVGGLAVLFVAFVSPLCALASALFSARIVHHVLLVAVAAPLLVAGGALRALPRRALPERACGIGLGFGISAVTLWLWHAPAPYRAAMESDLVYWAMELSLLGGAVLLWRAVLAPQARPVAALAALGGTIVHTGMLGAVITFAPEPLYAPHFGTTVPFGLTGLADQQLAGLVMWVAGALPYLLAGILLGGRLAGRALGPADAAPAS